MKRVHIIHDPYKLDESTVADVESPLGYLKSEFKDGFPEHAKIYKGSIAVENDITEKLQKDELLINLIDEDIWVVIWPAWIQFVYYAVVAITAALSIYTYLTMPKLQQGDQGSPNNELGRRQNKTRIGGRVPDVYGTVRAYPDLIAESYTYYNDDGVEIERQLLCIGSGYYQINDVKDASTNVEGIAGTSISIYDPNTSITGTPIYQSGRTFTDLPLAVIRSPSITGQTLDYPNDTKIESRDLYFTHDGKIHLPLGNLNELFSAGDSILISGASFSTLDQTFVGEYELNTDNKIVFETPVDYQNVADYAGITLTSALVEIIVTQEIPPVPPETEPTYVQTTKYRDFSGSYVVSSVIKTIIPGGFDYQVFLSDPQSINPNWNSLTVNKKIDAGLTLKNNSTGIYLDDTYTIESVSATEIKLSNPSIINSEWNDLSTLPNQSTQGMEVLVNLDKVSDKWVGWHKISKDDAQQLIVNLHFPQGIYRQNSKGGTSATYTDFALEYQALDENDNPLSGIIRYNRRFDGATRVAFGRTITIDLPVVGSVRFRACKTRESNPNNEQATMNIKDVYLASKSSINIYDGVTVIQSEAIGSDGLYSIKGRKLNCLVTRKLPINGTGALTATRSAAQALIYLALDDKNGRRSIDEVDIAQIIAEENAVKAYFGNPKAAEFSYTFDDNNLSFEEIAGMVASSMFCEAYRYGNKLRIRFEKPQPNSVLLFNTANKAPNTEKRTKNFGVQNKHDGVEIEYTSPDDDTRITYVASDDENPTNTMQIKTSGIRSHEQAKTRAWREWNKLKYRNITCEFEALEESELLARNDMILVADNTVIKTKDGIIDHIDGLTLGLSHPIDSNVPYFIYLQLADGRVDIVPCSYVDEYTVLLSRPPLIALVPEFTTYQLIESTESPHNAFMVTEIRPQGKMTNMLTCVNYDERYYQNDADFF